MLNGIVASQSYNPYASYAAYGPQAGQGTAVRSIAIPAAQPEMPVTAVMPVRPVKAVQSGTLNQAGLLQRWENDPAAMAVRGRIQYGADAQEADQADQAAGAGEDGNSVQGAQKAAEEGECQTCKERKYQDGSDDPGVSFKTAAHIDPSRAAAVVRGHEQEHVVREQAKARQEDREVVSQSVTLHTEICPECGKAYISGGTTRTVTRGAQEVAPAEEEQQAEQPGGQDAA